MMMPSVRIGMNGGSVPQYGADMTGTSNGAIPPTAALDGPVSMQPQPSSFVYDPRNLEIKTKSVEQTLLPLVTQISTLVNFKESIITGNKPRSERALRAALKIGSAVEAAVERFVVVGETIADENPDIQPEMYDACHNARLAGASIANLHSAMMDEQTGQTTIGIDKSQLIRAARQLLSSVTRVLLLADRVLVKHILRAEDKIAYSLTKLESTSNFTEFVKIFTEFGGEMVDLAHRSGDRQHDLKSEKRKAQMAVARSSLERLTMLLLTASKALLRHPEDISGRQCRDGVFYQIRLSLQLVADCITDGVIPLEPNRYCHPDPSEGPLDIGVQLTASIAIRQLMEQLEMVRMTSMVGAGIRERLVSSLDSLCELTQDFTDSSSTPAHQREQILDSLEECRFEMTNLVHPENEIEVLNQMRNEGIEVAVERLNRRLKDLRKQLQVVAMEQIAGVFRANEDHTILNSIKTCSVSGDMDGVEKYLEKFRVHAAQLQEICRLLHHISMTDALHVYTGHAERNLRALAPLTLLAGRTLCIHPSSRIARENLEVFCDTWAANVNDLSRVSKDLDAAASGRIAAEKQAYMSLPRPGVSCTSNSSLCSSVSLSSAAAVNVAERSAAHSMSTSTAEAGYATVLKRTPRNGASSESSGYRSLSHLLPESGSRSTTAMRRTPEQPKMTDSTSSLPPGGGGSVSAFVKYQKPSDASPEEANQMAFNVRDPQQPVIMRQKPASSGSSGKGTTANGVANTPLRAPLAQIEDDDEDADEQNSSAGSATSVEKRRFEYRISLIIDSLQMEADSLKRLENLPRAKLPTPSNGSSSTDSCASRKK